MQWGSALMHGVIQLLLLVGFAKSMALMGSALSTTAPQPSMQEEDVWSMAVAARKCARWMAAVPLKKHVVSATSMVRMKSAPLMGVPTKANLGLNCIVASTAVEERGRCFCLEWGSFELAVIVSLGNLLRVHPSV